MVERCLEKAPRDRVQSARELHADLLHLRDASGPAAGATGGNSDPGRRTPVDASIAVLPFASLSLEQGDEFFADGISEEIINALARLPELKVAARTSAFSFKGQNEDLRNIGKKLGVNTVLEGSVRRSGARLRITAQLVDVATGYHIWSERYDREMLDVFEIQDDIARSIASRLTTTLRGDAGTSLTKRGTSNLEAFRLYAQGRGLLEGRSPERMRRAMGYFERALEQDANYALAWSGLAEAIGVLVLYRLEPPGNLLGKAEASVRRAMELDADLAEAHGSLALLHEFRKQGPAAIQALERAVEIRPGYADAHSGLAWQYLLLGAAKRSLDHARQGVEFDPLSPEAVSNLSLAYLASGYFQEALQEAERTRSIQPGFSTGWFYEALALWHLGRFAETEPILRDLSVSWAGLGAQNALALAYAAGGKNDQARSLLAQLAEANEHASVGAIHAALGEKEEAFEAFEREKHWNYWPTLFIRYLFPDVLGPLRNDPRYDNTLRKVDRSWGIGPEGIQFDTSARRDRQAGGVGRGERI